MRVIWRKYWVLMVLVPGVLLALWGRSCLERPPGEKSADYAKVEDLLYVGRRVAEPPKGTEAVLNLSFVKDPYTVKVESWQPIEDGGPAPSLEWLKERVDFVAAQRAAGRQVYVHCDAGMSRGPMVTAAYLMQEHKWGRDKALAFLKKRRPVVGPNQYFMVLLLQWEWSMGEQIAPGDRSAGATVAAAMPGGSAATEAAEHDISTYSWVEAGLYVGGHVLRPPEGTQAVLSLSFWEDTYRNQVAVWNWQPIRDGPPAPSVEWLRKQVEFVAAQRKEGRVVYVHCDAGVSRGPMVVTAYLMWEHHWGRDEALAFLKKQRPVAEPGRFFMALLLDWEKALAGAATKPAGAAGAMAPAVRSDERMLVQWRMR